MRNGVYPFLIIVFLAFVQTTVFSLDLVLLAVLLLAVLLSPKSGLIWAFMAGIILDFAGGRALGPSSLIFLMLVFLLNLYKSKFKAAHLIYLVPFTFFSTFLFNLLKGEPLFWLNFIITTLLIFIIWPLFNLIIKRSDEAGLQLPLKI